MGSGPTMLARIAVMRALNRHVERVFNPDRKDTHWGNGSSNETSDRLSRRWKCARGEVRNI
jgi:hypothetical protein